MDGCHCDRSADERTGERMEPTYTDCRSYNPQNIDHSIDTLKAFAFPSLFSSPVQKYR